ncbi:cAMP-binding domain of CRP or a regulatory subunit of cAMP-dependent protein kinases [Desulfuromusa kysingii]|uniref:cAMP-binding domain of CRP or a regulatory subunit of cAMP-dependent protein kinases n=1 Tax=Desulfuromusa kysingii TaxID=37625 RepID=A0A1H3X6H1_9BACT|nr:Crp/Fnr family transcriptional regulator [Desulfuromusa kysingii]SDZ94232.1 cAMP-binding domain of CRP or a regulatory subunit of cAMP-dependent protein kinases [Desulfuromusa kysingii]
MDKIEETEKDLSRIFSRYLPWMDKPAKELEAVFEKHGTKKSFKKNAVFKFAYEKNDYMYFTKSGICCTFSTTESGQTNISRLLTYGSIFGEVAPFCRVVSLTNTIALEDSVVYKLNYKKFVELISQDEVLVGEAMKMMAWRIYAYHVGVFVKSTYHKEEMMALLFKSLMDYDALENNHAPLKYHLNHQQISELIGASRETVSRTLSQWHKHKILVKEDKDTIVNYQALDLILANCPYHLSQG